MAGMTTTQNLRFGEVGDPLSYTMQRDLADDIATQLDAADVQRSAALRRPMTWMSRVTALSLPVSTYTAVPFTSAPVNTHAMADIPGQPTRATVTAAAGAGRYLLEAHIQFLYTGWTKAEIAIFKNGAFYVGDSWASPKDIDVLQLAAMVDLNTVTDFIDMRVNHEGGGTTSGDWFMLRLTKN